MSNSLNIPALSNESLFSNFPACSANLPTELSFLGRDSLEDIEFEDIDLKLFDNQGVAVCLGGKGVELDEDVKHELYGTGWGVTH